MVRAQAVICLALWMIGAGTEASRGQDLEAPRGEVSEELEVSEVLLDVLVTDKTGQVILGLGRDDFVVTEEGEPVEITGLTFYSSYELLGSKEPLEAQGLRVDEIAEDRYFILLVQQQRRAATDVPGLLGRQTYHLVTHHAADRFESCGYVFADTVE